MVRVSHSSISKTKCLKVRISLTSLGIYTNTYVLSLDQVPIPNDNSVDPNEIYSLVVQVLSAANREYPSTMK